MRREKFIVVRIFFLLIMLLWFTSISHAQQKVSVEDRIIGSTFKTLAKAFVVVVDINKLKKCNIGKLNKMSEDKFQKRYAEVYDVLKDLPVNLKVSYGINAQMTKEQVIKHIESLDEKKIYEIIDSVPDTVIANQFKLYLRKKKEGIQKSNIVEQINKFWNKIIEKAKITTPPLKPH